MLLKVSLLGIMDKMDAVYSIRVSFTMSAVSFFVQSMPENLGYLNLYRKFHEIVHILMRVSKT